MVIRKKAPKKYTRTTARAIDGDTLSVSRKIQGSNRIRLANFNAPELKSKGGKTAKAKLDRAVKNKKVTIIPKGRSYSRVVADVKVGRKVINKSISKKKRK